MLSSSMPPKNKDGSYRDEHSNTLEDAATFERHYNSHMYMNESPDYDPDDDDDDDDDEDDDDYDLCKCSDPGCPCSGIKRGGPP